MRLRSMHWDAVSGPEVEGLGPADVEVHQRRRSAGRYFDADGVRVPATVHLLRQVSPSGLPDNGCKSTPTLRRTNLD